MDELTILVLGESPPGGQRFSLRAGQTMVGRGDRAGIRLPDDLVSRQHAVITRAEGRVFVEDAGSANGTFVNGEPVSGRRDVRPGDVIRLGHTELLIAGADQEQTQIMTAVPRWQAGPGPVVMSDPAATTRSALPAAPEAAGDRAASGTRSPLAAKSLILDAAGAAITALALSALKVPEAGTAVGAAIASVVTAFVQTPGRGQVPRILAAAALAWAISATGITIPEIAIGRSLADPQRPSTLLPARVAPQGTVSGRTSRTTRATTVPGDDLGLDWEPRSLDCGETRVETPVDCAGEITVTSTGTAPLRVTGVDQTPEFFVVDDGCTGEELSTGESCAIRVRFAPTEEGRRSATLVIHQNLPPPDRGSPVELTGTGLPAPEPE